MTLTEKNEKNEVIKRTYKFVEIVAKAVQLNGTKNYYKVQWRPIKKMSKSSNAVDNIFATWEAEEALPQQLLAENLLTNAEQIDSVALHRELKNQFKSNKKHVIRFQMHDNDMII